MLAQVHLFAAMCDEHSSEECEETCSIQAPSDLTALNILATGGWLFNHVEEPVQHIQLICPACAIGRQE